MELFFKFWFSAHGDIQEVWIKIEKIFSCVSMIVVLKGFVQEFELILALANNYNNFEKLFERDNLVRT